MCCTTWTIREAAMATTGLTRAAGREICWPRQQQKGEANTLRVNWVVATDENGNRQLRMCWQCRRE